MKWIWSKEALLVFFLSFPIGSVQLVAQESNNGNLEIYSSGYLKLGLEVTNGNSKVSVINSNGHSLSYCLPTLFLISSFTERYLFEEDNFFY